MNRSAISFQAALDQTFHTIRRTMPRMGTDCPRIGRDDLTYERCGGSDWVDGFWSGQLWLAYRETQDPVFLAAAHQQRPYFIDRLNRPESHSHDLGFLFSLSTGDDTARAISLGTADALTKRYNPAGRFIQAWNDWDLGNGVIVNNKGRMIVDCLENLALLYWASQTTGEPRYAEIATAHARTSARFLVRDDGSTYHTFFFDPASGTPLRGETHQGYADESCWSRGQSWAIHGSSVAYTYTRLPDDAPQHRDTSAAAILAAGLFLLADHLDDGEEYRDTAHRILTGLITGYTTADSPIAEGLLRHGAAHAACGRADNMLPYGDYFYVEALLCALGCNEFFW